VHGAARILGRAAVLRGEIETAKRSHGDRDSPREDEATQKKCKTKPKPSMA
jgi:hypothetical protein